MKSKYKSKAEEVEKETIDSFLGNPGYKWYTKEQVEELLQKQRELCYNSIYWKDDVDKDSILNAKLEI